MNDEKAQEIVLWLQDSAEEIIKDIVEGDREMDPGTDPTALPWDEVMESAQDQLEAHSHMSEELGLHPELIWRLLEGECFSILHYGYKERGD